MAEKKKKGGFIAVIIILLLILAGVGAFFIFTYAQKDINGSDEQGKAYTLNIESSDFQYEIAQDLMNNEIIISDTLWSYWMDKNYPDFTYINGEYNLTSNMSYEEIAQKLQNPDISHKTVSVCIPEGYTVFDIAKTMEENGICSADDFLDACKSKDKYDYDFLETVSDSDLVAYQLEGFLFPATYDLGENTEAEAVVRTMLDAFDVRISDKWIEYCNENYITMYELITLASVVEKETLGKGVAQNIASVFLNRLNDGQKLQSDVTIFYGNALRENGFGDDVVESYNTYKCAALPSGPICNPGTENINAVVNHADTDYYYFFSDLENEFHFARDYDEFEKLKQQFPWE
ncbi:MAG: endolytic transglycosylase MltG [Eubacterium sp.]